MARLPQVLRNVRVADRAGLAGAESVWAEVAEVEADLGERGRVLLRPERHRAAGPGDGRGADRGRGRGGGRPALQAVTTALG